MKESLIERIRKLKTDVRLSMDGVVASGMRAGGIVYKYNFGVKLPMLKNIAASYAPDLELARAIRGEDFREMQLIAPMLFDPKVLSLEEAREWIEVVTRIEIADNLSANLLEKLSFACDLSLECALSDRTIVSYIGMVLAARLMTKGLFFTREQEEILEERALNTWIKGGAPECSAALLLLKRIGRKSKNKAMEILRRVENLRLIDNERYQADIEDLSFEFEFYHT